MVKRRVTKINELNSNNNENNQDVTTKKEVIDEDKQALQCRISACGFIEQGELNKINKEKCYDWFRKNGNLFFKDDFKFVGNAIYTFTGKHWEYADTEAIKQYIYQKFNNLYDVDIAPDINSRVFDISRNMGYIPKTENWNWNKDFNEVVNIAFRNGTLTLNLNSKTHIFEENVWHKENDAVYCLNVDFKDELLTEEFWKQSFVGQYLLEYYTQEDLNTLQQYLASVLLPQYEVQKCLIILGQGGDGKGVLMNALRLLFGNVVSNLDVSKWSGSHDTTALINSLLNITNEAPSRELNVETFKTITACDTITINPKFEKSFNYKPYSKHILTVNDLPKLATEKATMRRLAIIQTIKSAEERSVFFKIQFEQNIDALISFMLCGLFVLKDNEFKEIEGNIELEKEFIHSNNGTIDDFVNDCIEITKDTTDFVSTKQLFLEFENWKVSNAPNTKDMTKDRFSKNLNNLMKTLHKFDALSPKPRKVNGKTERGFVGIKIVDEWEKED